MYGTLLSERYLLFNLIGRGVYSKVWLTYDIVDDRFLAAKIIHGDDHEVAMKEMTINDMLSASDNLGVMIDGFTFELEDDSDSESSSSGTMSTYYCMIFPLFGGTLYDLSKHRVFSEETLQTIFDRCKALITELHEEYGLVHGDIKPENIAFEGTNPRIRYMITRVEDVLKSYQSSFSEYAKQAWDDDVYKACDNLIMTVMEEDDYNSDDFYLYNSSNESSTADSGYEPDDDESEDDESGEDVSEDDGSTDESSESGFSSLSSSSISSLIQFDLSDNEIRNLRFRLIDYSHAHLLDDEDVREVPTRYYRCIATLEGKPAGFYKDWFAIACTMYELKHAKMFANPRSEDKDAEQIEIIKRKIGELEPWLVGHQPVQTSG